MAPRKRKSNSVLSLADSLPPVHQLRVAGRFVRKRLKKPGAAPGELVHTGPQKVEQVRIHFIQYQDGMLQEKVLENVQEAFPVSEAPIVTWVNIDGLHEVDLIRQVGERLSIHPLVLEDIVTVGQRPKVEEHEGYLYLVLPMLSMEKDAVTVHEEQLSIILGPSYVFTFLEDIGDVFDPVRERIRTAGSRIRQRGADFLTYSLVDAVVDHYFTILEAVGDVIEHVEAEVVQSPRPQTMHELHGLKREILIVRRAVWPVRDMLSALLRSESPLVSDNTRVFLRDVYDHAVRIIDTVETLRDVVGGIIDLYLSSVSNRTNEVMKALTVMASIFIPLTFIVGIYGMNFDFMPELRVWWAYPILWLFMASVATGMLWHFKRRGWL